MARIYRKAWTEDLTEYSLHYGLTEEPASVRFGIPCDKEGKVCIERLQPEGLANFLACVKGTNGMMRHGVVTFVHSYRHAALLLCDCGRTVALDGFTCPCECGRDYNASGSLLAPRAQWGEETGESLADILRIP